MTKIEWILREDTVLLNFPQYYPKYRQETDENERVRIEAPEMFRVLGKLKPEFVRPIHAKGAIRAALSQTINEPDAEQKP